jgi:hypothetical protein
VPTNDTYTMLIHPVISHANQCPCITSAPKTFAEVQPLWPCALPQLHQGLSASHAALSCWTHSSMVSGTGKDLHSSSDVSLSLIDIPSLSTVWCCTDAPSGVFSGDWDRSGWGATFLEFKNLPDGSLGPVDFFLEQGIGIHACTLSMHYVFHQLDTHQAPS